MNIAFTHDTYFYPPRPVNACSPNQLDLFEAEGWWAQTKFDGTCGIFTVGGGVVKAMTRHGPNSPMKRWTPTPAHTEALLSLPTDDQLCVFVGETMHGRVNAPHLAHNPIILHDVLAWQGKQLTGTSYEKRMDMLELLMPGLEYDTHYVYANHLWRMRNIKTGLRKFYDDRLRMRKWFPEYEGVVIKRPDGKLAPCDGDNRNGSWQLKCRFGQDKDGVTRRSF